MPDFLKTSIFCPRSFACRQLFILITSNSRGQLSADGSSTGTLYCLNGVSSTMNTIASCNQIKPIRIGENFVLNYTHDSARTRLHHVISFDQ